MKINAQACEDVLANACGIMHGVITDAVKPIPMVGRGQVSCPQLAYGVWQEVMLLAICSQRNAMGRQRAVFPEIRTIDRARHSVILVLVPLHELR